MGRKHCYEMKAQINGSVYSYYAYSHFTKRDSYFVCIHLSSDSYAIILCIVNLLQSFCLKEVCLQSFCVTVDKKTVHNKMTVHKINVDKMT